MSRPCWTRRFRPSPLQFHADAVVVDEFDAGVFEGLLQGLEGRAVRGGGLVALELADGGEADLGAFGEFFLSPSEEDAGGAAEGWRDHGRYNGGKEIRVNPFNFGLTESDCNILFRL